MATLCHECRTTIDDDYGCECEEHDGTDFGPDGPRGDFLADYWANLLPSEPYDEELGDYVDD